MTAIGRYRLHEPFVPAGPHDSVDRLRFDHVLIQHLISERHQMALDGDLWLRVIESTAQPMVTASAPLSTGVLDTG